MMASARRVLIPRRTPIPAALAALRTLSVCQIGGETMGTTWSAKMALPRNANVDALRCGIERVLAQVIAEMSPWEPASDLSRFNAAPAGTWHPLADGFFKVLSSALSWAERTGGAYDPTVGAIVDLWGFGPFHIAPGLPDGAALDAARTASCWRSVRLDKENRRVFQPGGVRLDLCAIAKGYAVDEVVSVLRVAGVSNLLVEIGGELRGEGLKPDGSPWWVEFERPRHTQVADGTCPETVLALAGLSVATSGDEQRYFEHGGRRYAHTVDPRTGFPTAHNLISVTVVSDECMTADVLATALTVLGPEEGPAFAAARGFAARFVSFDGRALTEHITPALAQMLS